ncbi:MAG: NAD(P)-dependent oxidoreductase [Rhizobiaceae bacterium]|nr:NAD(P)-dependent oxidoreductase [Rhizobiaceae bacterium]
MKILVTGSSGHLGEAIVRTLRESKRQCTAIDISSSATTDIVGSLFDRNLVKKAMAGVDAVIHTATLHKPHIATHSRQDFVDTNITGTLNLLEEAVAQGIGAFIYTSTTSVFGNALVPPPGEPAAWISEDVVPIPKNIYGITKFTAENLCQLFYQKYNLPALVLRTSRFFPEEDDSKQMREGYCDDNSKANEFLARRVEISDVVSAHLLALEKAKTIGFERYIISATTPFCQDDLPDLRRNAPLVLQKYLPQYPEEYNRRNWKMFPIFDRIYSNEKARNELGWKPVFDFKHVLERLKNNKPVLSPLAASLGKKGYHAETFADGPYPIE